MTEPTTETSDATVVARAERAIERMSRVREAIGRVLPVSGVKLGKLAKSD